MFVRKFAQPDVVEDVEHGHSQTKTDGDKTPWTIRDKKGKGIMRILCGTILAAAVTVTCAVGAPDGGNSVPECGTTSAWRPSVR